MNAETDNKKRPDNNARKIQFRVAKGVAILPNIEASVSVTISSAERFYIAPHASLMQIRVVLPSPVIVKALPHIPRKLHVENFSKKRTTLPKGVLTSIRTDILLVIFHLDQAATIPGKKKKEEDKSVAYTVAAMYSAKKKDQKKTGWTDTKKLRPSITISWIQIGEKTSIMVHSTPKIVRRFWTNLPKFTKCGTDV